MKNQDYKLKYQDLKLKFMDAVDVSFRLGMEQGMQQAQMQQMQQQADQQAQQEAAMAGQDPNAQPGQEGQDPNAQPGQDPSAQNGSELDQHIGQLESMLQKFEPGDSEYAGLKKSLDGIKAHQNSIKSKYDLRMAEKAIAAIGKAMKSPTPFTIGKAASKNLSEPIKKALSMQEQIVSDLMKSMDDEEKKVAEAVNNTLSIEQLLKR